MTTVKRWDEWFDATGDEESQEAWTAAKSVYTDPVSLDRWATIIELNRLDRVGKQKTPQETDPAGCAAVAG